MANVDHEKLIFELQNLHIGAEFVRQNETDKRLATELSKTLDRVVELGATGEGIKHAIAAENDLKLKVVK